VATCSRLLQIIGLFCQRALWNRRYSAKETSDFNQPTNRSHPLWALTLLLILLTSLLLLHGFWFSHYCSFDPQFPSLAISLTFAPNSTLLLIFYIAISFRMIFWLNLCWFYCVLSNLTSLLIVLTLLLILLTSLLFSHLLYSFAHCYQCYCGTSHRNVTSQLRCC